MNNSLCLTVMLSKLLLLAGVLPVSVFAAGTATMADFCENPVAVICGEQDGAAKERELKIEELRRKISHAAWERVQREDKGAGTYDQWEKVLEDQKKNPEKKLSAKEKEIAKVYYRALYEETRRLLGDSFKSSQSSFKKVKKFILSKIKSRLKNIPGVGKMKAELASGKVEFLNFLDLAASGDEGVLEELAESCGRDGMADNAFAEKSSDPQGKHQVIVCPGSFVADFVPGRFSHTGDDVSFPQWWTLGHETGHLVDYTEFPQAYGKLKACVEENYKGELSESVEKYMHEISGDYWGTEVLADFLREINNDDFRLAVLRENLDGLCNSEDDGGDAEGGHPSGSFRLENLVRRNPRLNQVLGCADRRAEKTGASCSLRGIGKKKL